MKITESPYTSHFLLIMYDTRIGFIYISMYIYLNLDDIYAYLYLSEYFIFQVTLLNIGNKEYFIIN